MSGVGVLVKAALPSIPGVNLLPGVRKTARGAADLDRHSASIESATLEPERVQAYAEVCGFPVKDTVPLPYPHLLAFPLQMRLMSSPAFPEPAIGTIHLENSITSHRPIGVGERLTLTTSVGAAEPHPVGRAYVFTTTAVAGDETVWEEHSTYLRRGRRDPDAVWADDLADVAPSGPVFRLDAGLGRRYARVSGDYNPIHLTPLSAKALGFPRQIAHGMWTLARCVAAMENRLPDGVRVDVAFKKPVFLPSSVAYGSTKVENGYAFSLHKRGSDTLHLLGRTTAL